MAVTPPSMAGEAGEPSTQVESERQALQALPVPGFLVQAAVSAFEKATGLTPDISLSAEALRSDPGTLVLSRREFQQMIAQMCAQAADPAIGLKLGRQITEANLHLLGPIIVASRTLREAIANMDALQVSLLGFSWWQLLEDGDEAHYQRALHSANTIGLQMVLTMIVGVTERFVGSANAGSILAHFACPTPADASPYYELFGDRVRFDAPRFALSFPRALLDVPRAGTDPGLASHLRQLAVQRFSASPLSSTWVRRVENALRAYDNLATVDLKSLAARWRVSERTLRRRVHEEGESITGVLNRVRFERARSLLEHSHGPLAEVAQMLGYSDVSSFQRAFKRWSGRSANAYRRAPNGADGAGGPAGVGGEVRDAC